MNIKKEEIIKYGVAFLAVLNLIWLFGFEYRLPAKADRLMSEEAAFVAGTASTAEQITIAEEIEPEEESREESEEEPEEETETEEIVVHCRVTASSRLNVREGPGINYKVVTTASHDEIVVLLSVENGWAHIRKDGGQEGYVSESYIEVVEDESE